ncbi:hypothetical protein BJF93_11370 [Xaviernesmea oryzae]|uniref:Uncharacterized protein n=1 Tax=Xaviernesmea oryzae TaxID=464029 RepID=A0A1Q9AW05_9HYPH|nr:hypothetical protein [Xaviernesmea oryzae]OLP59660.1 hypothetical protein BJF93_11370 [Xaviernesmea oryzae]SEM23730.1 hypothetical protein SAMN04487976_1248 [Xaviernesmea oryzae]
MSACRVLMSAVAISTAFWGQTSAAEGYQLKLSLTSPDARHDPDGVWTDDDLAFIRQTGRAPAIYTARLTTPSGDWLLSQTNGDCNMQGMCTALLVLRKAGTQPLIMANPQLPLGGTAVLSLNYRKLSTEEVDQNGQPIEGSYDVGPLK